MATILGTSHYSYWSHYYIPNDDTLVGSASGDYIDGGGGNDYIYADYGNDTIYGGYGNDTIYAGTQYYPLSAAYWGNDYVNGGAGDDNIYYQATFNSVVLSGDEGNDVIIGGYVSDTIYGGLDNDGIYGGGGNDVMYGDLPGNIGSGNDIIFGQAGSDSIYAGDGDDLISGGDGGDWLSGGAGFDTFVYYNGESRLTWETADTILDFDRDYDWIDMPIAGTNENFVRGSFTSSNYTEHNIFNDAFLKAESLRHSSSTQYAFVTDGHDGYLFANTDGWTGFDTGVQLRGLTSINDLHYYDVI